MEGKVEKMLKGMKKVRIVLAVLLCLSVSGCGNGFAKQNTNLPKRLQKQKTIMPKKDP